jgi:O-antigen/teichoic acid export membrane protein
MSDISNTKSNAWIIDQVLVSGANFVTGIILARFLGLEEFGKFAVIFAVFIYLSNIQRVLTIAPLVNRLHDSFNKTNPKYFERGYSTLALLLASLVAVIVFFAIKILFEIYPNLISNDLNIFVSLALFCYLIQDWLRRYLFAIERTKVVLAGDLICYMGQIILLGILAKTGNLTLKMALFSLGVTSFLAYIVCALYIKLGISVKYALGSLSSLWPHGRYLLVSWQFEWMATHGILILSGFILGPQAAGAIRAIQNILGPIHIVLLAIENIIPIEAAKRLRNKGLPELNNYLSKWAIRGGLLFVIILIPLIWSSEWILYTLYGKDYSVFWHLVALQFAVILAKYCLLLLIYFFRAIESTKNILVSTILWASITICLALTLIPLFGVTASIGSVLAGELVAVIYLFRKALIMGKSLKCT